MADISLVEFIVYGFFAYSGAFILMISILIELPNTKSLAFARSIYLIPGIVCAGLLATSGVNVDLTTTSSITTDLNSSRVFSETTTNVITLQSPEWEDFHFMLMAVLLFYVIQEILIIMTRKDPETAF